MSELHSDSTWSWDPAPAVGLGPLPLVPPPLSPSRSAWCCVGAGRAPDSAGKGGTRPPGGAKSSLLSSLGRKVAGDSDPAVPREVRESPSPTGDWVPACHPRPHSQPVFCPFSLHRVLGLLPFQIPLGRRRIHSQYTSSRGPTITPRRKTGPVPTPLPPHMGLMGQYRPRILSKVQTQGGHRARKSHVYTTPAGSSPCLGGRLRPGGGS